MEARPKADVVWMDKDRWAKPDFETARAVMEALPEPERLELLRIFLEQVPIPEPERDYLHDQRSREELPFPDLPAGHNANKTQKQTGLRLPPETLERVNEAAKQAGASRNDWIKLVLERQLALG